MDLPTLKRSAPVPALPKTVPDWITEEFRHFPELARYPALMAALMCPSGVSEKTWKSIATRERTHRKRTAESNHNSPVQSLLLPLARFLERAYTGFNGEARLTIKKRREIGSRIQRLSQQLGQELERFDTFHEPVDWIISGASANAQLLRPLLGNLIESAEAWKTPRVHVHRPTEANAHRTFFMRTLSMGFTSRYGTPLQNATLEYTGVFFDDMDNLDVSGVSRRLKPRKRRVDS